MLSAQAQERPPGARQLSTITTAIEISGKYGNTLIPTLHKVYGRSFAGGYPETEKLSEALLKLNENLYAAALTPDDAHHLDLVAAI